MPDGFHCSTCGQFHDQLPMSFGTDAPELYSSIPSDERDIRCELNEDLCVIDQQYYFIRGCLEVPVRNGETSFVWGVWVSLSRESFIRQQEIWDKAGRESEPPFFGWLSTLLPVYPNTLNLKTNVHTRPIGQRPFIELEPTDHPLAVEQRAGITKDHVRLIAEQLLH